jgi:hypothetical protein
VQRQGEAEEEEPQGAAREGRGIPKPADRGFHDEKGKGEPLEAEQRTGMESAFGADFGGVRIHTGGKAAEMSRKLRAHAFTHGPDIFFGAGEYEPRTTRGRHLLAHELTHVVQQGAAEDNVGEASVRATDTGRDGPAAPPVREEESVAAMRADAANQEIVPVSADGSVPPGTISSTPTPAGEAPLGTNQRQFGAGESAPSTAEPGPAPPTAAATAPAGFEQEAPGALGTLLLGITEGVVRAKRAAIARLAGNERRRESAEVKLSQTERATVPPVEEGASRARAGQVKAVEAARAPEPDEARVKKQFTEALESSVPTTLEEVDEFKERGKGREVGRVVHAAVAEDTGRVRNTYQEIGNAPPPPRPEEPEALPDIPGAVATPPIGMGDGIVGDVPPEHTDLSEYERGSDDLLEEEQIKEEQLAMVDEGDLAEAQQHRATIATKAKEAPLEAKVFEEAQKRRMAAELRGDEAQGRQSMREERRRGLVGARGDQTKTKSRLEQKRQAVTDKINAIYGTANTTVQQKLQDLETGSLREFEEGQERATATFEDNVKSRMNAFKSRRYSGVLGGLRWAKDAILGMDDLPEVESIFESEKAGFVAEVDAVIGKITAENKRVIAECESIVAKAREEIDTLVGGLRPELRQAGQQALADMRGKLDALDGNIDRKQKQLQAKLAEKRNAAVKAIEEKIDKMKEEMSGLLSKLGDLLLNAMVKFFKWALKKAGYDSGQLMGILNKGKTVVTAIVTSPVRFIGNLVTAVRRGVGGFVKNIKTHLVSGLVGWLSGAMADVPIKLPAKWDLKGILHLVLQVLGLTWDRIRVKLVKRLGEPAVRAVETTVDILRRLAAEGPIALWEMIKEKAAEIEQKVMDGIRNWVVTQVVRRAVVTLFSFLNPAGAIVQAILAIYNSIMFFVENWQRIVDFVKTVFGSIADIAMGKLSAAAQAVENALARTIPIILAFLARLAGLSGIGKSVTAVIRKIRKPIDRVVDKVIDRVASVAQRLLRKGKARVTGAAGRLAAFIFPQKRFRAGAQQHRLSFKGKLPSAVLTVASTPEPLETHLKQIEKQHPAKKPTVRKARGLLAEIVDIQGTIDAVRELRKNKPSKALKKKEAGLRRDTTTALGKLASLLAGLLGDGDLGTESNPYPLPWPKPAFHEYEPIFVGPRSNARIRQKHLEEEDVGAIEKSTKGKGNLQTWRDGGSKIDKFRPNDPRSVPDGETIGIKSPYDVTVGMVFKLPKEKRGTPGGRKINKELKPFGYRPKAEGRDGDHVLEIQMGGKDVFENLWPLDASTNRRAGGFISRLKFDVAGKSVAMSQLKARARKKDVWLRIVSTTAK